jgi:hypothetical protein
VEPNQDLSQALAQLLRTDPHKVVEAITGSLIKQREDAKRRIEEVRKELEDGARPRTGRFRL